jgi:hypothetical protein
MAATAHATRRKVERQRTCRIFNHDPKTNACLVRIDQDGTSDHYHVIEVEADFGQGFRMTKHVLHDDGSQTIEEPYHVLLAGKHSTCECMGHLRWGRKTICKHIAALTALKTAGKLS